MTPRNLNLFAGPSCASDNAPAVNGSLPHPSVMAGAIDSELRRPLGSQTVAASSDVVAVTNSTAAALNCASLFSSVDPGPAGFDLTIPPCLVRDRSNVATIMRGHFNDTQFRSDK